MSGKTCLQLSRISVVVQVTLVCEGVLALVALPDHWLVPDAVFIAALINAWGSSLIATLLAVAALVVGLRARGTEDRLHRVQWLYVANTVMFLPLSFGAGQGTLLALVLSGGASM